MDAEIVRYCKENRIKIQRRPSGAIHFHGREVDVLVAPNKPPLLFWLKPYTVHEEKRYAGKKNRG